MCSVVEAGERGGEERVGNGLVSTYIRTSRRMLTCDTCIYLYILKDAYDCPATCIPTPGTCSTFIFAYALGKQRVGGLPRLGGARDWRAVAGLRAGGDKAWAIGGCIV